MSNGDAYVSNCKRQKVVLDEQIDRISSLPDPILALILSLLPTEDAVKTVLIRRFGNLWTSIHNLDFDVGLYPKQRLINLIRHVLILHERSDIHRFRLKLGLNLRLELANEIDTWIRFAIRRKVKVLDLDFKGRGYAAYADATAGLEGYHKFPNVVLTCDTLTELKLVCCRVQPREHIQLRSLKYLSLNGVLISDKMMIEILSGCPALESLFLYECYGFHKLDFTSLNLKNVVIELNCNDNSRLEVSCPYVMSLNITGIERTDLYNVSSVVDAALELDNVYFNCARGEYHDVKMLFERLHDVEAFTLFSRSILVFTIWELTKSSCPSMNLRRLVLKTMLTKWHFPGIASLLKNFPDLEMLDIHIMPGINPFFHCNDQWLMHYEIDEENFWDLQQSSFHGLRTRSHLKTIRIRNFKMESCAVKLVYFLLRNAYVLEKLVIETKRVLYPDKEKLFISEQWTEFSKDLECVPRASPQAVILWRNL